MTQLFAFFMPFAALPLAVAGCSVSMPTCARGIATSAKVHEPPQSSPHPRAESQPIHVDYKITRADTSNTILLAGQSDLDLGRSAVIERHVDHDSSKLRLSAERGDGDTLLVSVEWDELSHEGQALRWSPTLAMGSDGTASAKLDLGGGEGRKVTVTVHTSSLRGVGVSAGPTLSRAH